MLALSTSQRRLLINSRDSHLVLIVVAVTPLADILKHLTQYGTNTVVLIGVSRVVTKVRAREGGGLMRRTHLRYRVALRCHKWRS